MSRKFPFQRLDVLESLGITPLTLVTDEQIWTELFTPMTRALLGDILDFTRGTKETVEGEFPGDKVSNLNNHLLYGGQSGFVRMPYHETVYRTAHGAFVVKRDGVKVKAFGWFGDYKKGKAELIFMCALRDRRFDGTKRANDTALLDFEFDDPKYNSRLSVNGKPIAASAVELSAYCFMPGSRIVDASGDAELDQFVEKPFTFLDRPELFLQLFKRVWNTKRSPGQNSNPIPDVSKLLLPGFARVAKSVGYDFIQNAPSHYHVAMWTLAFGYDYVEPAQAKIVAQLAEGIKRIKANGVALSRQQESWVCVLQSLREDLIPGELKMHGPKWPQDNIGQENLWMYQALNDDARKLYPK
jgi:hypothetical protein